MNVSLPVVLVQDLEGSPGPPSVPDSTPLAWVAAPICPTILISLDALHGELY